MHPLFLSLFSSYYDHYGGVLYRSSFTFYKVILHTIYSRICVLISTSFAVRINVDCHGCIIYQFQSYLEGKMRCILAAT